MEETHCQTSHLEKKNKDLEEKLTSVSLNLYAHCFITVHNNIILNIETMISEISFKILNLLFCITLPTHTHAHQQP